MLQLTMQDGASQQVVEHRMVLGASSCLDKCDEVDMRLHVNGIVWLCVVLVQCCSALVGVSMFTVA